MITLHRAPWVLPISSPALADGAVIVDEERILAVGPYADLRLEGHDLALDHEARILMPGLVNGHCHLELSPFAHLGRQPAAPAAMAAWIADLLALRAGEDTGHGPTPGAALAALQADGVGLVLDIGNALLPPTGPVEGVALHYVTELLSLSEQGTAKGLQTLAAHAAGHHFTCHAPYSTSSALLQAVKKRARLAGQLYPLHVAESLDEVEFLQSGQGPFRTFLKERGVWDGSFTPPATGPVHYLERLDLLDHQTLCVHAVHLGDDEIQLLAEKKAKVCLCPGSNRFLGVGRAQPEKMLAAGIRPCLGTDSLASNPQLSLWREMAILAQDHPGLPAETIVAMATRYGAEALGQSRQGHLQKGSCRPFLAVAYGGNDPFEFLVRDVAPKELRWL